MVIWAGNSPECRFADNVLHICRRRDGRMIVAGEPCFMEARAQLDDERRAELPVRCLYCRTGNHGQCELARHTGTQLADVLACTCHQYHPTKEKAL